MFTAIDAANYRRKLSSDISAHLQASAISQEDAETLALADIMAETAKPENIWHAKDLHNSDGELFDGYGSLTMASTRLEPAYMQSQSRRAAKRAERAITSVKPLTGTHRLFITLTLPDLRISEYLFSTVLDLLDRALVLLKKRDWFKKHVQAAVISDEFTLGEEFDHWHAHAHILCWSKRQDATELRRQWTSCVVKAMREMGIDAQIKTADGLLYAQIKFVYSKSKRKRKHSKLMRFADAIKETVKYIVKGNDFEKIPVEQLCDVERSLHRRRMLETYGCNNNRGRAEKIAETNTNAYVHTECTTDGKSSECLSLRRLGAAMIRAGKRREWLEFLASEFERRREWRKQHLRRRYPFAEFQTLTGEFFYGWKAT